MPKGAKKMDLYEKTTEHIVALMQEGKLPWQQAWDSAAGAALVMPVNGKTNHPYNPFNSFLLSAVMREKESTDPRFFTIASLQEQNRIFAARVARLMQEGKPVRPELRWEYRVKKGSKGIPIIQKWHVERDKDKRPLPEEEQYWARRITAVFHAADCIRREYAYDKDGNRRIGDDGKPIYTDHPLKEYVPKAPVYTHEEQHGIAEAILAASGAVIRHDQADQAFFSPRRDEIHLPPKEAFPDLGGYYATALHELAHWTGHESRMNREMSTDKTSRSYAREELRAELASTFLSLDLGIPLNPESHAAYLQSWIEDLKADKMAIFKAATDARKIVGYIKRLAPEAFRTSSRLTPAAEGVLPAPKEKASVPAAEPSHEPIEANKEQAGPNDREKQGTEKEAVPSAEELFSLPVRVRDGRVLALPPEAQANLTGRFYKYYPDHPVTSGSIPKENLYLVDAADKGGKHGAVYYEKQLSASQAAEHGLAPDYDYFANKAVRIAVYYRREKAREDVREVPRLRRDYEKVAEGNYLRKGVTIAKAYAAFRLHPPEGKRPIQAGDLIEADGYICRAEENGFTLQELHRYHGDLALTPLPPKGLKERMHAAVERVGPETFQTYIGKLQQNFYLAGQSEETMATHPGAFHETDDPAEGERIAMQLAYAKDFRERAFHHGLSAYTPADQKGWHDADLAFAAEELGKSIRQGEEEEAARKRIGMAIQRNSPYAAVSQDRFYGANLTVEALRSPYIQRTKAEQNTPQIQDRHEPAAAQGVGR